MSGNALAQLLPLLLIVVIFWLLIIRPARRRQTAMAELQRSVTPGTEVMLSSGIFGTVQSVEDDVVTLSVSDTTTLRVHKQAINQVVRQPKSSAPAAPEDGPSGASAAPPAG